MSLSTVERPLDLLKETSVDLLPVRFVLQLGGLTVISGTLFDYDDDDEPAEVVTNTEVRLGFATEPVDEVGMTGLEPLEDDDDDEDPEDCAGDRFGFAAATGAACR